LIPPPWLFSQLTRDFICLLSFFLWNTPETNLSPICLLVYFSFFFPSSSFFFVGPFFFPQPFSLLNGTHPLFRCQDARGPRSLVNNSSVFGGSPACTFFFLTLTSQFLIALSGRRTVRGLSFSLKPFYSYTVPPACAFSPFAHSPWFYIYPGRLPLWLGKNRIRLICCVSLSFGFSSPNNGFFGCRNFSQSAMVVFLHSGNGFGGSYQPSVFSGTAKPLSLPKTFPMKLVEWSPGSCPFPVPSWAFPPAFLKSSPNVDLSF